MKTSLPRLSCLILTALLALFGSSAHAATFTNGTWINNASSTWSTTGNWSGGGNSIADGVDATADFSTINLTSSDKTVTLDSSRTIGNLKFGDPSPNFDWILDASGGSTLTLQVSSGTPNIEIVNQTTTISLVLAGNQGFTKLGAGTLTLGGGLANTYTGTTIVSDGTLRFGKSASVDAFGGDLTINGGTVNYLTAISEQIANTANVTLSSGTFTLGARTETIGQTSPSAAGSFTMSGGSLTISSGNLNLSRNPKITGGTVTFSSSGTLQANQDLIFSGGTIDLGANINSRLNLRGGTGSGITYETSAMSAAQITGSGQISLNGSATTVFDIADSPTVGTEISIGVVMTGAGTPNIEKRGAGVLLLSGANTYSGTTTINAGTIVVGANAPSGSAGALGNAASAVLLGDTSGSADASLLTGGAFTVGRAVTVQSGSSGTATLGGNTADVSTFSGNITVNKSTILTAASGGEAIFSGVISGSGFGVNKTGDGIVTFNGANTYTGGTTLSQGTLTLGADNALGSGGFTFAGGILNANSRTDSTIGALSLTANSTLNLVDDLIRGTLTFDSAVYASGTLTIYGWSGSAGGPNSANGDQILITTPSQSFLDNLHQVQFDLGGQLYFGKMSGNELMPDLTAVPEPINVALGVFGGVFVGIGFVRRFRARRPPVAT